MIRFRLLDQYGNIVDGIDVLFPTGDIHAVRRYIDSLFGELRQYGMRLHLKISRLISITHLRVLVTP